ncbi:MULTISPECIES: FAD-dependent oxidoreductase [Natrialbaceae]|uniref:FAD-dependent oxidoreductase n=1 Tax=Natrialbaceae TaxID=1644061 RepID=UPI00207C12BA|nr:FAD-dependent oxidoreductase [Natronococcus sp. CG52]
MSETVHSDVAIIGGGVAGRAAGIFAARHGFDTVVLSAGSPLLRRNAHLENYPGFPAGVNSRLLLDMMRDQAERSGCTFHEADVTRIEPIDDGFSIETASGDDRSAAYVIAATKNATDYLSGIEGVEIIEQGNGFVETDERGRTGVDGLYAAGRLAAKPHQTIVAAGHGAEVAVTLLEDHGGGFFHDWVAPEGYFTERGINVPPGVEEIDEEERRRRERESMEVTREYFADPHPDEPEQHPNVR